MDPRIAAFARSAWGVDAGPPELRGLPHVNQYDDNEWDRPLAGSLCCGRYNHTFWFVGLPIASKFPSLELALKFWPKAEVKSAEQEGGEPVIFAPELPIARCKICGLWEPPKAIELSEEECLQAIIANVRGEDLGAEHPARHVIGGWASRAQAFLGGGR